MRPGLYDRADRPFATYSVHVVHIRGENEMKAIKIPFRNDMALAVISGRKHCTTRSEKMGEVGDVFPVVWEGITLIYKLRYIEKRRLGFVAQFLYVPEGFDSVREFIDAWNEIHPRRGFRPEDVRWVHWFEPERT